MVKVLYILLILLFSCASKSNSFESPINEKFNKGVELFERGKYLRAQDEFNSIVIRGSGTDLGDDAQFYLAESYYYNKEYILAISEYEKLTRKMPYSPFVEEAKFKICESYKIESPKYYHDQTYTNKSLDRYQEFLDDYPNSEYKSEVIASMRTMREKLSKKVFETGVLYMKMDEFESARMVFEEIENLYYDTKMIDQSRLWIVKAYARDLDLKNARKYFEKHSSKFKSSGLYIEAENEISRASKRLKKKES